MGDLETLALLSLLVVVHEAGHFASARLKGIPISAFSVGLGPKLWSRRWGRTEYSFRALPVRGFVIPDVARLRPAVTLVGVLFLAGVMTYANVHDVVRFWG
ncbi:MAG TPA: site-2 protease family protein [Thermoanaerobaculia bacterium]|jgi:hypothetical protein|nr:site-2 protease family protein [Thermoanaerobaculia bacterium]